MYDAPDLYAFVLILCPLTGQSVRPQGHGAQALFLDLLRQVTPALAEQLHADAPSKPFTVGILPGSAHNQVLLRVTLLQHGLFQPFVQALLRQMPASTPLRLGRAALTLGDVIGTPPPRGHAWAGYGSFADLHACALPTPSLTLEFASATAIGQGSRSDGRARLALLPTPEIVFKSLARRWDELCPPDLRIDQALLEAAILETMVSRHRIESVRIDLGKGPQVGFVGLVSYELPTDQQQARLLSMLADAALFLGVGTKTARGMGMCRRLAADG